jgi:multidrug efflux pump subunit AcrB
VGGQLRLVGRAARRPVTGRKDAGHRRAQVRLAEGARQHHLHRYRLELAAAGDPRVATERALASVGRAMVTTSVVLFAGFWLMALSAFPPHRTFGLVLAGTMVVALCCDLLLLPALLLGLAAPRRSGARAPLGGTPSGTRQSGERNGRL